MATNKIKGLTVEIGGDTTKLGKALEDVNKKSRDLSSELGEINRLLKMDPGNTELLAQKQKVLADAVSNTSEKLEKLKEAEKQVQAQFERGEVSEEQVRALQREILATSQKLEGYERAAKETADEIDRLGKGAGDAANSVEEMGDEAKKTEKASEELGDTLDNGLKAGFTAVIGAATAAAAAVVGCVEASQEYRQEMGKLDTAFTSNNHSSEAAKATYEELQSVIGETDQAVEAANHLAALADTEEELSTWTDILTGVYAKFGVSLPVEGLAEAANETKRTGQLTGVLTDAINWASEAGETFGVKLKEATKENEEWNEAVKEATSAEEYFQLALDDCSTEQERQQLITKTLTKLYKGASDQYKKTNKDVIDANKATEKWNATVAEIGAEMAPVTTEIKAFGASILEEAKGPLKDTSEFITDKLLPALSSISRWVLSNGPTIKAGVVGVTTALVGFKVATVAAEVAQNGLKKTIMATTVAQKALALAQAATPWGLAATAIAAVVAGLIVYAASVEDSAKAVDALTEEERELISTSQETATALREQRDATAETMSGIAAQMDHVQKLASELQTLADKSGKVKEADEARAQFILNELNEALGTEYTMTDGVIQKYGDLVKNINEVIQAKTVNALLETQNADYVAALQAENDLLQGLVLSEKDYQAQLAVSNEATQKYADAQAEFSKKMADAKTEADYRSLASEAKRVEALRIAAEQEKGVLNEKKKAYDDAALAYGENADIIMGYEEAQTAALEGNYDRAKEILKGKSAIVGEYADNVSEATARSVDALYKEAIDAGVAAARIKANFEAGVKGYTKEMVRESEQAYEDALGAWADARMAAEGVGEDLGSGLSEGMENKRSSLLDKARSLVKSIINAFRKEADSHSPSKKTIAFGEDLGEGPGIGIENKTKEAQKAARRQVGEILDAYTDAGEDNGPKVFRNLAQKQASAELSMQAATSANSGLLTKILEAIEAGQVLMLDGDTLVGGTAEKMDRALGQRRILAERGAI